MQIDNLFLIGFMGVGKSTIAKTLAETLHMELVEMDETIERTRQKTINEIFAEYGEEGFRDMESALVEHISCREGVVVSCGGGTVLRPQNVERMKKSGKIIFLTAAPQTIFERVRYSKTRPLLNAHMNIEHITELMERRRTIYENAADIIIPTDEKDPQTIVEELLSHVL